MSSEATDPADRLAQTIRETVTQHIESDARYRAEMVAIASKVDPKRAGEVEAAGAKGAAALSEWHRTLLAAADALAAVERLRVAAGILTRLAADGAIETNAGIMGAIITSDWFEVDETELAYLAAATPRCVDCQGFGTVNSLNYDEPCTTCNGSGFAAAALTDGGGE